MKLLYRISRIIEPNENKPFSVTNTTTNNINSSNQVMENIQRPPTPPPSPKPAIRSSLSTTPSMVTDQYSNLKDFELKKPRCEVTPVMRAPDLYPSDNRLKPGKSSKMEHHKRKKRKNKIIAEITTTPREDLLKLKVRLTPCPPKITSSSIDDDKSKDKTLQIKSSRKEKTKSSHKHRLSKNHKTSPRPEEDVNHAYNKEEFEKKVETTSEPENVVIKVPEKEKITLSLPTVEIKKLDMEEIPKNEEVLRKLGLVAVSEANRTLKERPHSPQASVNKKDPSVEIEKLEKKLRESKANLGRSLMAEKQRRDILKSIMSISKETNFSNATVSSSSTPTIRSATPTPSSLKRKDPPPLTPLRSAKRPNVTFAPNSFTIGNKYESPLDLSSPSNITKEKVLDLSSSISEITSSKGKIEDKPVGILRNNGRPIAEKSKEEGKKSQDSNLRILSDAAVSLSGDLSVPHVDKSKLSHNFINVPGNEVNRTAGKVALKIPQPHQRITGFGLKIKPNIGVRHIPNPSAVVASQYRNQRTAYFNLVHQPP